jgi:hypothetical protein
MFLYWDKERKEAMKYNIAVILLIPFVISCSNCKTSVNNQVDSETSNHNNPTSIVQNSSIVTAIVNKVIYKSETEYQIIATVTEVEENNDKPVIAVKGNTYTLSPNFRYNGNELLESDVNNSLKSLGKILQGKKFKAEILLDNKNGWLIQNVISFE